MAGNSSKIFGIGLSKTGTTSLAHALEILGYRTKDYLGVVRYSRGDLSSIDLAVIDANDALTDTPLPSFYRELDARYPNSKFILTVRAKEGWLTSSRKQFTQRHAEKQNDAHKQLFIDLYGTDVFDERKFIDGYEAFVNGVLEHFKNRPGDLLVIDVAAGEGWDKLCRFLDKPVPHVPFPKANVTQLRWIDIGAIIAVAKQAGQESLKVRNQRHRRRDTTKGDSTINRPTGANMLPMITQILEKCFYALRGGDKGIIHTASRRAHGVIVKRLKKLTPGIPILSRVSGTLSYPRRADCNHLWLVDPLAGSSEFLSTEGRFAVSIALLEDRRPIYGVVYAPVSDTVYYAKGSAAAFKIEHDKAPQNVKSHQHCALPKITDGPGSMPDHYASDLTPPALAMCLVAEGKMQRYRCSQPTMEWEIAAAHVVANAAGKRVCDCRSKEELRYNKTEMVNECFTVE